MNRLIPHKALLFTLLMVLVGAGNLIGQNNQGGTSPGLPGEHGLPGNQDGGGSTSTLAQQTLTLSAGWNWISLYLECDADLLTALKEGLGQNNTIAVIKNMGSSTMLQNGSWSGSLSLTNTSLFMVNLSAPTTVTLTAPLANPADHPITLAPGWNWIGYPLDHSMSISEALSGITPHQGDQIKNMSGTSSFTGNAWQGSLNRLEPGDGYMYYNSGAAMTLVY